jgi:glutamate N-acetyltransferase/amino-acid N-acetyltransferase
MDTLPKGYRASGVAAGIKKKADALDIALIASDSDCTAAAVFTTNKVKAAPVLRGQKQIASYNTRMRAVLINAGCANACTGKQGIKNAETTAKSVATALGLKSTNQVFVMSTGVIGVQLPMDKIEAGAPLAVKMLSNDGLAAASHAIMTTDTQPKVTSRVTTLHPKRAASMGRIDVSDQSYTITGIAKGAGMIHPNMATMLSVVVTDAKIGSASLQLALSRAAKRTFNRISVDGDTSTNDTLLVLANGASGVTPTVAEFEAALTEVCTDLAKKIARDGEGATKFITVRVTGAANEKMAETVGRTIATSPLVKTAFYGEDANWGRIVCAAGYSGADVIADKMSLWFGGVHVFENGAPTDYNESAATAAMKPHDVEVHLDLGLGKSEATIWTCDFSHEYVTVNGKYRT